MQAKTQSNTLFFFFFNFSGYYQTSSVQVEKITDMFFGGQCGIVTSWKVNSYSPSR